MSSLTILHICSKYESGIESGISSLRHWEVASWKTSAAAEPLIASELSSPVSLFEIAHKLFNLVEDSWIIIWMLKSIMDPGGPGNPGGPDDYNGLGEHGGLGWP